MLALIYPNFIRNSIYYGRLVKKDHRGQAILKIVPSPVSLKHEIASSRISLPTFTDFHKDIGEGAILCFKDTGEGTFLKIVSSPVSLKHEIAPSPISS